MKQLIANELSEPASKLTNGSSEARSHSKPRPRTTRRSNAQSTVELTDDEDDSKVVDPPAAAGRRVMKAVVIPRVVSKIPVANGFVDDRDSTMSLDNSDYETPGTSISTTPATSMIRGAKSKGKMPLNLTSLAGPSTTRKRTRSNLMDVENEGDGVVLDLSVDEQLARQLQDEEDSKAAKRYKAASSGSRGYVVDSEDDEELSSVPSEAPSVQSLVGKGKGKGKANATGSKAKGKAKATDTTTRKSHRSGKTKQLIIDDPIVLSDASDLDFSDEDEFELGSASDEEDKSSINSDDDDDEIFVKPPVPVKRRGRVPVPRKRRVGKGKGLKTRKDKEERDARNRRFAHIEDVWERKRAMNRDRAEENHSKLLTMWDDLAEIPVLEVQKAEQPSSINRRLKPFQLEGLSWMTRQEQTMYKGGLLGDEMGMCSNYFWGRT